MNQLPNPANQIEESVIKIDSFPEFEDLLKDLKPPVFKEFGLESFLGRNKKHVKLIANRDPSFSVSSKYEWLGYEFFEINYIDSIRLQVEGVNDGDEFVLSYTDSFSKQDKQFTSEVAGGFVSFPIAKFIQGFGLRAPSGFWKHAKLNLVEVSGIAPLELERVLN